MSTSDQSSSSDHPAGASGHGADAPDTAFSQYLDVVEDWCADVDGEILDNTAVKSVGTYFENSLRNYLYDRIDAVTEDGNPAHGVDIPAFNVDLKVTKADDPQSSSTVSHPLDRITGLPYAVLLVKYSADESGDGTQFCVEDVQFIPQHATADTTRSQDARRALREFQADRISRQELRERLTDIIGVEFYTVTDDDIDYLLENPPATGATTVSTAMQWRVNYSGTAGHRDVTGVYGESATQSTLTDWSESSSS